MVLQKIVGHKALLDMREQQGHERRRTHRLENIIGQDRAMYAIYHLIEKAAQVSYPVLITGETGSGKELVAQALHYRGPRAQKPLKKVNCAALTETLFCSELFGHEKGAFTDAHKLKKGLLESARGGTLLLDEISEMSLAVQASLLRAIESKTFYRVGGSKTIQVDVRILCATNGNLPKRVDQKRFREDLYYRISAVSIDLPPLRQRKTDIPLLVNHFIKQHREATDMNKQYTVSRAAMQLMCEYDWPGNVRELVGALRNAALFCTNHHITPGDLPRTITAYKQEKSFHLKLRSNSLPEAEKALILRALTENNWNITHTADDLKIGRSTLYSKMKMHGISK